MDQPTASQPTPPAARSTSQPTWSDSFSQLDSYADQVRVKLPIAHPGLLNAYMTIAPWVAIVVGVLGALVSLVALAGSTILGPLMVLFGYPGSGFGLILGSVVSLAAAILAIIGGTMMLQRKITGWWVLAFGIVVNFLNSLFHVTVISLIIILAIAYVHLEVKPNYR